ncbi:hypothetical protein BJ322DRAFT_540797 [Thelephora terrestris]|uniref:Protein kinase domain-containing protein n=1 Tax=Thelephora terrestris TaxID=56493 RepID=A0A9P6HL87_9AGAM|nr:hypothetical protein BJ322DRAFT_540797 [Thelephora terrestris]
MSPHLAGPESLTQPTSFKANIYIKDFRACIAGFSVSTIARAEQWAGASTVSVDSLPSFISGGSLRWMSPELLDPSRLEDRDPRPTKESDCFALGMVIYEVRDCQKKYTLDFCLRVFIVLVRSYADMCRTMGGRRRGSTMRYCKGSGRISRTMRRNLGLWTNCGSSCSGVGKRGVRRGRSCRPSVIVWKGPFRFGTPGRI